MLASTMEDGKERPNRVYFGVSDSLPSGKYLLLLYAGNIAYVSGLMLLQSTFEALLCHGKL